MLILLIILVFSQYTPDPDFDYPLNDVGFHNNTDPPTCQKHCDDNKDCVAYVIDFKQVVMPCWLKSKLTGKEPHAGYVTFRKSVVTTSPATADVPDVKPAAPNTAEKAETSEKPVDATPVVPATPTIIIENTPKEEQNISTTPPIPATPIASSTPASGPPSDSPSENIVVPETIPTQSSESRNQTQNQVLEPKASPRYPDAEPKGNANSEKSTDSTAKTSFAIPIAIGVVAAISLLIMTISYYWIRRSPRDENTDDIEKFNYESPDFFTVKSVSDNSHNNHSSTIYKLDSYHPNQSPYKWNSYRTTDYYDNDNDTMLQSNNTLYSDDYRITSASLFSESTLTKKSTTSLQETCFSASEFNFTVNSP